MPIVTPKIANGLTASIKRHKEKQQQQAELFHDVARVAGETTWRRNKKVSVSTSTIRGKTMNCWLKEYEYNLYYVLEWDGIYLEPFRLAMVDAATGDARNFSTLGRWLAWRRVVAAELNQIEEEMKS